MGATSASIDVVVTNISPATQILGSVAGGAAGDPNSTAVQNCVGATLAPGASCVFSYAFAPLAAGVSTATTSLTINGQSSGTITLTGATPGATVSPSPTPSARPTASTSVGGTTVGLADTGSPVDPIGPVSALLMLGLGAWLVVRGRRVMQPQVVRRR